MNPPESKAYSWRWATASALLSHGPCELVYAYLDAATAADYATLYNGENATGVTIAIVRNAAASSKAFSPRVPVYCDRGLYVAAGTGTSKVFAMWRELKPKKGGE